MIAYAIKKMEVMMELSQDESIQAIGGNTELMIFSSKGDIENAKRLLRSGADINVRNEQGATALLIAVLNNHPTMVSVLLGYGADAAIASKKGLTPIALAKKSGNKEIVQLLKDTHSKKEIVRGDGFIDGYGSKKEALGKIVNAVIVIFTGATAWGIYAYSTGLLDGPSAELQRSVFVAGISVAAALGYFNMGRK